MPHLACCSAQAVQGRQRHLTACRPQGPYRAVGQALEVIPRTLAQNCGANVIRTLTKLRAKHAEAADCTFGIDGALCCVRGRCMAGLRCACSVAWQARMPVQGGTPAGESTLLRGHFLTALCRPPRCIGPAGNSGQIVDMKELGVWEPYQVGWGWGAHGLPRLLQLK